MFAKFVTMGLSVSCNISAVERGLGEGGGGGWVGGEVIALQGSHRRNLGMGITRAGEKAWFGHICKREFIFCYCHIFCWPQGNKPSTLTINHLH